MMKKKTVRLISGAVAGILVGAMLVSVVASGIVYAGAASSSELKDKLSSLEDQKAEIKKELDSTANKVSDVEKTRAALQKEITLTKEEIETVRRTSSASSSRSTSSPPSSRARRRRSRRRKKISRRPSARPTSRATSAISEVLLNSSSFSDLLNRLDIVSTIMDDNKKIVAEYTAAKEDIQQKRDDLRENAGRAGPVSGQPELQGRGAQVQRGAAEGASGEPCRLTRRSRRPSTSASRARWTRSATRSPSSRARRLRRPPRLPLRQRRRRIPRAAVRSRRPAQAPLPVTAARSLGRCRATLLPPADMAGVSIRFTAPASSTRARTSRRRPAQPSLAAASGTVTTAGWVSGYGNYTVINHGGGVMTAYGHQSAIYVSVGQTVSAGQTIGAVGSTGNSTGPHLHFEVYVNGATQSPMSHFS